MSNPYESDELIRNYLLFHYGTASDLLPEGIGPREAVGFARRLVGELLDTASLPPGAAKALDVGCAVGGSTFELARHCQEVIGIDYSAGFIQAARTLCKDGQVDSLKRIEGERFDPFVAHVDPSIDRSRVDFQVGDAMAMDTNLQGFDVVLAANLICRLSHPQQFLSRLDSLVRPGGQLLLTTPFTWLEDYTPKDHWLGRDRPSFDDLHDRMESAFTLEYKCEIPFLIREHARKFQYGIAIGSRWRRLA